MATEPTPPLDLAARFQPDYTPEQLEQLGVYDALYRGQGPRLASLGAWKPEWISEHDPKGWAQWYKRYASGRRIPDEDERQIQRWLNLKSRHGGPFVKQPTPRRGWALRNWAIDPAKLVAAEQQPAINAMLEDYQRAAMQKHVAKSLPPVEKAAELLPEVQLQPHQQRIADRVTHGSPRLLVYHGLGSGKSLSALAAAEAAKEQFGDNYGIVAPAALRGNFDKEVRKFTTSSPEILSYTGLGMGKKFTEQPDTLVMDEAHRLRNPSGAAAHAASEQARQAKNLLLLTGSPITNDPSDLANLLGLIDNKPISPEGFRKKFVGTTTVNPNLYNWFRGITPGEREVIQNEPELRKLLRGKVDYQPSKNPAGVNVQEETIHVPLSPAQQKIQKAVRTKIPPGFLWKLDQEFPLSRDELGKLNSFLTGLRQVSMSTRPFRADKDPLKAFDQSAKLQKALANLKGVLESDPRKKAIIYSNHIDAGLAPYAAALEKNKIPHALFHGSITPAERQKAVQDYNAGKLRALLIGPAGAEGLSTRGTSLIQLLDPHWHESRSQQARGRGLRFDSHEGLPEELKNVDVQRYISSSEDPSWIGKLMGYTRERTGDEVLEHLAREKEMLNDQFRKVLQDEGRQKNAVFSVLETSAAGTAWLKTAEGFADAGAALDAAVARVPKVPVKTFQPDKLTGTQLREMFANQAARKHVPSPRAAENTDYIVNKILTHRQSPEITADIGALPRSTIPASELAPKTLKQLGFLPSYVAVPERGQSQLRTFRHPYTGMHLHRHGDRWIFHEDNWPSLSMQVAKYNMENPDASQMDRLKYQFNTFFRDSLPHVAYEGAPGYVNYIYNTVLGKPTFGDIKDHVAHNRSTADQIARGLTASALLGAVYSGAGHNPRNFFSGTGAGLGFLGGTAMSKQLESGLSHFAPGVKDPGPANLLITAGTPLAGLALGHALGGKLYDSLPAQTRARVEADKKLQALKRRQKALLARRRRAAALRKALGQTPVPRKRRLKPAPAPSPSILDNLRLPEFQMPNLALPAFQG